jgi:hypothetical protein
MKYPAALLALLVSISTSLQSSEEKLASLESLKWKHRVLVVFAEEPSVGPALSNLRKMAAAIEERDMVWFLLASDKLHTNYPGQTGSAFREQLLDRYFTPLPVENMVLLIGKDGGVKSRDSDLDLEATFGLVDQMPMRKAEMLRAGEKPN